MHAYLTELKDGRILATYSNYHLPFGVYAIVSRDGGRTWDRVETDFAGYNLGDIKMSPEIVVDPRGTGTY